ncbi:MAG: hypothetical protein LUE08_02640 [Akkermansiaceae bacterium]|nr:hypothetical protein [Akkermansiaceae bacterium]
MPCSPGAVQMPADLPAGRLMRSTTAELIFPLLGSLLVSTWNKPTVPEA